MNEQRPLHRLFGLSWIDFFDGTSVEVKTELDLSLKQQFVDVVLIRKGPEPIPLALPDGFEDLADHNLITFKSHQEALDEWALQELVGHYVNYRKQSSDSLDNLRPPTDYRLFAVCARYPQKLAAQVPLAQLRDGVYEARGFGLSVRVVVASQLPQQEQNAMLHLFSVREELLRYGRDHYRPRSPETSTVLYQLLRTCREDPTMSPQMKEFVRATIREVLAEASPEERLEGLPAEELRKGLSAEELRKGLSAEERLKGLSPEEALRAIRALPPEVQAALAQTLRNNEAASKPL